MITNPSSLKHPYWILVVDNDGLLADAYKKIIEQAGGRPLSAGDSKTAMVVLKNKHIDAVLLGLQVPDNGGLRLLQWIDNFGGANLVKIVLSNNDNLQDIAKAYELGADRYVLKAWASPNDLINVLNETLAYTLQNPKHTGTGLDCKISHKNLSS